MLTEYVKANPGDRAYYKMNTSEWKVGDNLIATETQLKAIITEVIPPGSAFLDPVLNKYVSCLDGYCYILELKYADPNKEGPLYCLRHEYVNFWKNLDKIQRYIKSEYVTSNYPHTCPYCNNPAYIGLGKIDCSMECNKAKN